MFRHVAGTVSGVVSPCCSPEGIHVFILLLLRIPSEGHGQMELYSGPRICRERRGPGTFARGPVRGRALHVSRTESLNTCKCVVTGFSHLAWCHQGPPMPSCAPGTLLFHRAPFRLFRCCRVSVASAVPSVRVLRVLVDMPLCCLLISCRQLLFPLLALVSGASVNIEVGLCVHRFRCSWAQAWEWGLWVTRYLRLMLGELQDCLPKWPPGAHSRIRSVRALASAHPWRQLPFSVLVHSHLDVRGVYLLWL